MGKRTEKQKVNMKQKETAAGNRGPEAKAGINQGAGARNQREGPAFARWREARQGTESGARRVPGLRGV